MYGQRRTLPGGAAQRRYRCKGRDDQGLPLGCGRVFRDADALDEYVTKAVFARLRSPEATLALAYAPDRERSAVLARQLAGQEARRRRITTEYGRGEHTKHDYKIMLAAADEAIQEMQTESKYPGELGPSSEMMFL